MEGLKTDRSKKLFSEALKVIPGGVNSPVRAFKAVGSDPLFIEKALGSRITDVDGNEFIDYVSSFGPLILGHAHPEIVSAIQRAAEKGTSYGAPCEAEVTLAKMITDAVPSMEQVRMVNSGTEATMSAVRLARAFTGRDMFIKFEGCYHGHGDAFLVKAGSGMLTEYIPSSPGVPESFLKDTIVCRFNDIDSVREAYKKYGGRIAAVIAEPVPANMGLVMPAEGFLEELRELTKENGSLLIFDEVITGFRCGIGGYQGVCNVTPDLTTLGKIIGGGLPVGAYGGRRDIMSMVAPEGNVYQAGTLSGNPLAMAAGIAMLSRLKNDTALYERVSEKASRLASGVRNAAAASDVPVVVNQTASFFTVFFTTREAVVNYDDVMSCDTDSYRIFHNELLKNGIYFPPAQFEAAFVSDAHTDEDIDRTISAVTQAMKAVG